MKILPRYTPLEWKKTSHLEGHHIEEYYDIVPLLSGRNIAKDLHGRLLTPPFHTIEETVELYWHGRQGIMNLRKFLLDRYTEFSHEARLVSARGVDYLMEALFSRFQVSDVLVIMAKKGLIGNGNYHLYGPSTILEPAEMFDEIQGKIQKGKVYVKPVSVAVSVDREQGISLEQHPDLGRIILGQYTLLNLSKLEKLPQLDPIMIKIEGGDAGVTVEDKINRVMQKYGVKNGAFFIVASGDDMKVNTVVMKSLPKDEIVDLENLKKFQSVKTNFGGSLYVQGHFTSHHPDRIFHERTGLHFNLHRHGVGHDGNGNLMGGHVNGIFLGPKSYAYIILKPIDLIVEMDALPLT